MTVGFSTPLLTKKEHQRFSRASLHKQHKKRSSPDVPPRGAGPASAGESHSQMLERQFSADYIRSECECGEQFGKLPRSESGRV